MQSALVIDAIFAAVFLIFFILGFRKGLFQSLVGAVIIIVAIIGAGWSANTFTPMAEKFVTPIIQNSVQQRVDNAVKDAGVVPDTAKPQEEVEAETGDILGILGIYNQSAEKLQNDVINSAKETGTSILSGIVSGLVDSIAHSVVYILSFILIMIVLSVAAKVLGLLTAVPGLHFMNALGGGVCGLLEAALILLIATWLIRNGVIAVSSAVIEESWFLKIFMTINPVAMISGI